MSVLDIMSLALSLDGLLPMVCIYLLLSIVVYPLTAVIYYKESDIPFYMLLPFGFNELFTIPFIGLDISPIFMAVKYKAGKKLILRETGICIFRLFEMVVWWCLVITVLSAVFLTGDNAILKAISRLSTSQNLFVVICVFLIYLLMLFVGLMIRIIAANKYKRERALFADNKGTPGQRYYERHPEQIPSGCRACGGPYPECKSSCNLFDY